LNGELKQVIGMASAMDGSAPYAPPSAVILVIGRFRDRGLQTPFTAEMLTRAGVSESLAPRTFQALKMLGLVEPSGEPSEALQRYARAPEEVAKQIIGEVVTTAYAQVFSFADPAKDSPERVRDAFRHYEPRGQQERMVTLFYGLCEYAGIIAEQPKRSPESASSSSRTQAARSVTRLRTVKPPKMDAAAQAKAAMPDGLPSVIEGAMRQLVDIGPAWTQDSRDRFMEMLEVVIDFSYPVKKADQADGP